MAKHLKKFTTPFQQSRIPFLLMEVITDGSGSMVDLVCHFANPSAARMLGLPAENLQGQHLTHRFPASQLSAFEPVQQVAFSGSATTFSYAAVTGAHLRITCYQALYGVVGCILDSDQDMAKDPASRLAETMPGAVAVLELSRAGLRCLSFSQRLCGLLGWTQRELLDRFADDFSALIDPEDWPEVLQALLDAQRNRTAVDLELRLLRQEGSPLWVNLRAEILSAAEGTVSFYAAVLDIDSFRRSQSHLEEATQRLDRAQQQFQALLSHLPAPFALFRVGDAKALQLLWASAELLRLLGESRSELTRHLEQTPLWRIHPEDQPALTQAAADARAQGLPLRHICRFSGAPAQWLCVEAVWYDTDGETLLYAAFRDVTAQKEAERSLRDRSQLCDLLLERSSVLTLDYDPGTGSGRITFPGRDNRRSERTESAFFEAMEHSPTLHPDDCRRVCAELRRAAAKPGAGTLDFRANYNGDGWRWYELTHVSLFDRAGSVCRLLGKAEDITARKAAETRYRQLLKAYSQQGAAVASARLDLTEDRILDAQSDSSHLMRVLFGNTARSCLTHMRDNIPQAEQRTQWTALFSLAALRGAFSQGRVHLELEHPLTLDDGLQLWGRTLADLARDPKSGHLEVFFHTIPTPPPADAALLRLLCRDYLLLAEVDLTSGLCRSFPNSPQTLPPALSYRQLIAALLRRLPPSPLRGDLRRALHLSAVTARLACLPCVSLLAPYGAETAQIQLLPLEDASLLLSIRALSRQMG